MGQPWFAQKRKGIGLSPASAAGWIALAIFIAAMALTAPTVECLHLPLWFIWIGFAAEIGTMFVVIFAKSDGKPWRWRRGA